MLYWTLWKIHLPGRLASRQPFVVYETKVCTGRAATKVQLLPTEVSVKSIAGLSSITFTMQTRIVVAALILFLCLEVNGVVGGQNQVTESTLPGNRLLRLNHP